MLTQHVTHDARTDDGAGVVVVAAGSGTRLGADRPKALVEVAGVTLLEHALVGATGSGAGHVVVVAPADHLAQTEGVVARVRTQAVVTVVPGGAERTDSVAAGLAALPPGLDVVLVHDAARCLAPASLFERVTAAVRAGAAGAVPGLAVVDTIKVVDERGAITATPARASLRAVQTPQGFRADLLRAAHATGVQATDDAALVEALGHEVLVVEGDERALKVTTVEDLRRVERWLAEGH